MSACGLPYPPPVAPLNAAREKYLASDWHRILSAHNEEWDRDESDKHRFALADRLCEAAVAIWAKPVRTWDDLVVRAAMAVHWNMPTTVDEPPYPVSIFADPSSDFEQRAGAHVVRGILDLADLKFDADGRLA